jgi:virulence plasmid B protein
MIAAGNRSDARADARSDDQFRVSAPQISLPKGGGAIRGIDEKFAANPVTGSGSMTVPIPTSPGRSGFGPQLSLTYDSGAGNGPFGFGWRLALPSITRRTDKGLPRYRDAEDSDIFIMSGVEDLVPVYRQDVDGSWVANHAGYTRDAQGDWVRDAAGQLVVHEEDFGGYRIRRYRPRLEGSFARIERWTSLDGKETYWRSISSDNVTTIYGGSSKSRIADPADLSRIFSWEICRSYDDKGNAIIYEYAEEDAANVAVWLTYEGNRARSANRYIKRIKYGNVISRLVDPNLLDPARQWLFEVVFDYGEHSAVPPSPTPSGKWLCRKDPFSTYRAGFEVRCYRLCQRVLMFHRFAELAGAPAAGKTEVDAYLVHSTDFTHWDNTDPNSDKQRGGLRASFLQSVTQTGHRRNEDGTHFSRSLPPLTFSYSPADIDPTVREVDPQSVQNLPEGLDGQAYQWVDLESEGLSGILTEQADGWFYKRNLSPINRIEENGVARPQATLAPLERVATRPRPGIAAAQTQWMDLEGEGRLDLVLLDARHWASTNMTRKLEALPSVRRARQSRHARSQSPVCRPRR